MAARLTTYVVVAIVAATLIAGLIVGAQRDDNSGPVDLIIYNAKVYSADALGSMAEAVAVRGNTILRVGTTREILRYRRPQTTVIDAKGVAVVPGFNDAHASFIAGGLARDGVDLFDAATVDEMQQRLVAWSDAHPDAGWITGRGWAYEPFADLPARAQLDAAVKDKPVVLMAQDGHAAWVNTTALQAARITKRTPNPADGVIVRDSHTGEPTGLLKDGAIALVTRVIPQPTREERARALRLAIRDAQEHGVTSVQDIGASAADLELYDDARNSGDLTVRVYAALPASSLLASDRQSPDGAATRYPDDSLLKTGLAVVPLDGTVTSQTASMLEQYEPRASGSGLQKIAPTDLSALVAALDKRDWQIAIEANGDRAVRSALDAYDAIAAAPAPTRGRRHRIDGLEVISPDDLPRLRTLGLIASLQPLHGTSDRLQVWRRNLGPDRAPLGWASESLTKAGAHLAFGTDWPNLPMDPLAGLNAAVYRTMAPEGPETLPESERAPDARLDELEKLPLKSAINAWTSGAAWASFDEHRKGVIKPGMLADLVVLSSDIFSGPSSRLASTEVTVTIFDGKVVYQRDSRHSTN